MELLKNGKATSLVELWAKGHADALTRGQEFDMIYNEPDDVRSEEYRIDTHAVALIGTMYPDLPVDRDAPLYWHTTNMGIIVEIKTASRNMTRLPYSTLRTLSSSNRVRWAEMKDGSLSIALEFLSTHLEQC